MKVIYYRCQTVWFGNRYETLVPQQCGKILTRQTSQLKTK